MCTTPDRAPKFGFPASHHAHEFQPLKPQLLEADLHDLFSFIWARDTYSFDHPRYRLQVAFSILLIFHLGLTSLPECWDTRRAGTNEGYFDFQHFAFFAHPDNRRKFVSAIY
jgi:hypothetical protein